MLTQEDRDRRIGELRHETIRLAGYERLTAAQEARSREAHAELYKLEREDALAQVVAGRSKTATVMSGGDDYGVPPRTPARAGKFTGDPWAEPVAELRAGVKPGVLRGQALTAIERCEALPDAVRQRVTVDVEADDDPAAGLARATVELSQPAYRSAFLRWLADPQHGHYEWSPEERAAVRRVSTLSRAMSLGVPGAGGYLVPYELDPAILISSAGSASPMRQVARVTTTASSEKRFVTSAGVTASWDAELAEVGDDSPSLLNPAVTVHKGAAFVPVSIELFEDSADLGQQIGALFTDAKAQLEAAAFTLGTGTGQPRGVITAVSAVPGSVLATGTNALAAADVFANQAALPARWRPRARFMCNLSVLNGFRQLPVAAGLNDSLVDDSGPVPRMAGWQVVENSHMDGALTATSPDYALLSGDFTQYAIVDRIGTTVEVIPHLMGPGRTPIGARGFYMHWRTGADVLIPDAFRLTNYSG
ncbi:phage major capsid protein [Geodermatophilus chilensis]|uniref:phage major capsid protein n=1 Tax=Geodermatophilus chilensis TaxID=2035835 RepID=UPI000C25FB1F|nr:phage major capsid protein [Geodermatophilus chilensis]